MYSRAIVDTLAVSSKISLNVTDAFFTEKIFTILRLYFSILLECNLNITWIRWPDIYNTLTYVRPTHNWLVCTQSNLSILNHERIMKEKDVVLEQHEVLIPSVCVNDKDLNSSFNKTTNGIIRTWSFAV